MGQKFNKPAFSAEEIAAIRADTPACEHVLHFDSAGASLMPSVVSDYLHDFIRSESQYGGYRVHSIRHDELEAFYDHAAKMLRCQSKEIAFLDSATRAWDMVFYAFPFQPGDRVLTSVVDYGSNFVAYQQQAKRTGVQIDIIPNDADGALDVQALENAIDDRVKLISISHIPTGGGLINPAEAVGKIAKSAAIPYLLDTCQSMGQLDLDMNAIGCDMACGTGRKFLRGPRGTGLLYVRDEWIEKLDPPLLDQFGAELISAQEYKIRDDARRFETWEQFFAGKGGLAAAIAYANALGTDRIEAQIRYLAGLLRNQLSEIETVQIMDDGIERCGIVTFQTEKVEAFAIKDALQQQDIHVSVSTGSGSLVSFKQRGIESLVRASVHYFNTEQEIERFVNAVQRIIHS